MGRRERGGAESVVSFAEVPLLPPPSNSCADEPADLRMRFGWYADLVLAAQLIREVYGGSLDALGLDATLAELAEWQASRPSTERCGQWAVRVSRGELLPGSFPADGRDLLRYGFATAVAPRAMQPLCCLCSARRLLWLDPGAAHLGRGRRRPAVMEWRTGVDTAAAYAGGGWRDANALTADLNRALREAVAETAVGRGAESLPRAQLRALSEADSLTARSALASRARTAAGLAHRLGKSDPVRQK